MADKTYKMVVTLSNGSTVDAGTFVAPQGPQGPSGLLGEWVAATKDTELVDGTYIISVNIYDLETAAVINITNGECAPTIIMGNTSNSETAQGLFAAYILSFTNKKIQPLQLVDIRKYESGNIDLSNMLDASSINNYKYIKLL